jgi:predicted AAA+ superfamily ATPase
MDLMCISTAFAWDKERNIAIHRKPAKHHFTNLLAALCWHPDHPKSVRDFNAISPGSQGAWIEWAVAQELWRRKALRGDDFPEVMSFWQSDNHEIDFVVDGSRFIEVKRGKVSPVEYTWFPRTFPGKHLTIINTDRFETSFCRGVTLEDFLVEDDE